MAERCCQTCRHYLGGGCCRLNLEPECSAGDYEAWEPRERGGLSHKAETVLLTAMLLGSMMPEGGGYMKQAWDDLTGSDPCAAKEDAE